MPTTGKSEFKGTLWLASTLGLSKRKSRKFVQVVRDAWIAALIRREPVEMPFGWIVVRPAIRRKTYRKLGNKMRLYLKPPEPFRIYSTNKLTKEEKDILARRNPHSDT